MTRQIIVGKSIGFCFGVTKAVNTANRVLDQYGCLTTLGDLVHNPIVMSELREKGLRVVEQVSETRNCPFIIRSHGLPPDVLQELKQYAARIYDATCPFVKKVQGLVRKLSAQQYFIFLIGDPEHPEILAMKKIAGDNSLVMKPYQKFDTCSTSLKKWAVIAQTTISLDLYRTAIKKIINRLPAEKLTIFNTICPVSVKRQSEALELAGKVDALIVVGGRKSSNTRKLVYIGRKVNKNTFLIESSSEVRNLNLANFEKIGIISGASTDVRCIREMMDILRDHPAQKKYRR
ncbi:MAG TPA: 4-hydroxy-3-methylbut-2-enyl diphosphate reductase [bacterium]|nr:4-hydroxy-3-methylbut-2-enyl diphosphate reductase [bacterium]HOL49595.1 4-hydroxy-3-methylbut-2-enyl diphosphate reductase [bacterium]HPO52309.1 4-hydroxy-3-methylbut-2-enyl diphosphate reductase [bacterium]